MFDIRNIRVQKDISLLELGGQVRIFKFCTKIAIEMELFVEKVSRNVGQTCTNKVSLGFSDSGIPSAYVRFLTYMDLFYDYSIC